MTKVDYLKLAATISARAHARQLRKDGTPYFCHPVRVAIGVEGKTEKIVALLHDVCEDTDTTLEDLRNLTFSDEVIAAVEALTRRHGETYSDFVKRCKKNDIARVVKISDIEDNISDQSALEPQEAAFLRERYTKALVELRS